MDLKKVILAVIILLVLVVGAFFVLNTPTDLQVEYDNNFKFTLPSDFETSESNGLINSAYPEDKSYILTVAMDNETTADNIDSEFKIIQDSSNIPDVKKYFTDIKLYDVGNNKAYDVTITEPETIKDLGIDAKKVRLVSFAVPNTKNIYNLYFSTNDTSLNLKNTDIESIINSTSQSE